MKFKYVIVVLSLVGLSILYLISNLSQPPIISLSQVPFNEGKQIIVTGVVTMHQTTTYGNQFITIRDVNSQNFTTITLYVEGEASVEYGDVIQATGVVQQYNNNWELTISTPQGVEILQHWQNRSFPVWQLARKPMKYVDTNVNITGVITELSSTGFSLSDTEGVFLIPVSCTQSEKSSLRPGDEVVVLARFLYDEATLRYLLKIIDETHGIILLEG
jgi:DNA/RNA endonuclease YhcR with UshA esterase domain